jgi:hypothetical protein
MSDLKDDEEVKYITEKIRTGLGLNIVRELDELSCAEVQKQVNTELRSIIQDVYLKIIKEKCVELGIDPESVKLDALEVKL